MEYLQALEDEEAEVGTPRGEYEECISRMGHAYSMQKTLVEITMYVFVVVRFSLNFLSTLNHDKHTR